MKTTSNGRRPKNIWNISATINIGSYSNGKHRENLECGSAQPSLLHTFLADVMSAYSTDVPTTGQISIIIAPTQSHPTVTVYIIIRQACTLVGAKNTLIL